MHNFHVLIGNVNMKKNSIIKIKNYRKEKDLCPFRRKCRGKTHCICNLRYNVQKNNSYCFSQLYIRRFIFPDESFIFKI